MGSGPAHHESDDNNLMNDYIVLAITFFLHVSLDP
jgi:hypothetical protein